MRNSELFWRELGVFLAERSTLDKLSSQIDFRFNNRTIFEKWTLVHLKHCTSSLLWVGSLDYSISFVCLFIILKLNKKMQTKSAYYQHSLKLWKVVCGGSSQPQQWFLPSYLGCGWSHLIGNIYSMLVGCNLNWDSLVYCSFIISFARKYFLI